MILNTGEKWEADPEDIKKWQELYPAVGVEQELRAMEGWLDANPQKRKTARGIKRFINSWLSRAQDKGGSPMSKAPGPVKTRDMSLLDELTHDFTNSEAYRKMALETHGQYFSHKGERVTK